MNKQLVFLFGQYFLFGFLGLSLPRYLGVPKAPEEDCVEDTTACPAFAMHSAAQLVRLGPRVFGYSSNEYQAFEVVDNIVKDIVTASKDNQPKKRITVSRQRSDGGFSMYKGDGLTMVFQDVQNYVVRLSPNSSADSRLNSSAILLNCHVDTVPLSPGASDDAINCGIMLDILRALTRPGVHLSNDIIFLFNGAEETPLAGSYAFVANHPWAKDVVSFINLEAAGAAQGREMLFQTGPFDGDWSLGQYKLNSLFPYGVSVGQDLFQAGVIPSDTDFRIFRDFGNISGLDIAFISNGYVYHTSLDDMSSVDPRSVFRAGSNVLEIVKGMANAELTLSTDGLPNEYAYFDFFGFFFLCLGRLPFFICITVGLFVVVYCLRHSIKQDWRKRDATDCSWFFSALGFLLFRAMTLVLTGLVIVLVDGVCFLFGKAMVWYGSELLLIPLYVCPTIAANIVALYLILQKEWLETCAILERPRAQVTMLLEDVALLEMSLTIFLLWLTGLKSVYIITCFYLCIAIYFGLKRRWKAFNYDEHMIKNPLLFIPLAYFAYLASILIEFFVPVIGRMGSYSENPEFLLGLVIVFLTHSMLAVFWSQAAKLEVNWRDAVPFFLFWALTYIICLIMVSLDYVPYSVGKNPQRLWVTYTERTFYDLAGNIILNDSGVALERQDYLNTIRFLPEFEHSYDPCHPEATWEFVNCGVPFFGPRLSKPNKKRWIPTNGRYIPKEKSTRLQLEAKKTNFEVERYPNKKFFMMAFTLLGPPKVTAFISLPPGMSMVTWNLTDNLRLGWSYNYGNSGTEKRESYIVTFLRGAPENKNKYFETKPRRTSFSFMLEGPYTEEPLQIMVNGHYQHGKMRLVAPQFHALLNRFPDWTFPWAWSVDMKSYEFDVHKPADFEIADEEIKFIKVDKDNKQRRKPSKTTINRL